MNYEPMTKAERDFAESLFDKLSRNIDQPFPAVTVPTEQEAPNHNGAVAVLPFVSQTTGD